MCVRSEKVMLLALSTHISPSILLPHHSPTKTQDRTHIEQPKATERLRLDTIDFSIGAAVDKSRLIYSVNSIKDLRHITQQLKQNGT